MFGLTEYWARFPSALSGYATLILVYLIGVRLYGRKVGFLSMVILASSFFFLKFSRRAMLDVPVAFITILDIYALLRGEKEQKFDLLFGLSIALGYYMKAVQGLYIGVIGLSYLTVSGQWRRLLRPSMLAAYAVAAALLAVWVWPQVVINGDKFIYSQSGISPIIQRGAGPRHQTSFYAPFVVLFKLYWPWLPASLCGLVIMLHKKTKERSTLLIMSWVGVVFFVLLFSNTVFERYLILILPALALCGGIALDRWIRDDQLCAFSRVSTTVLILFLLIGSCLPIALDRRGYAQNDLVKVVNHVIPGDKPVLLYKGHDWATQQSLNFYADRYLDKQLLSPEGIIRERRVRKGEMYLISSSSDFSDIENSSVKDQVRFIAKTDPYGKARRQHFLLEVLPADGTGNLHRDRCGE
jgi:4-amino-4-deoxy-L-arabinose transferase-like glycosyltransferase